LEAKFVSLDTYPANSGAGQDFHIDPEKLEKLITPACAGQAPKTKAILLNSPNNPTGAVYTKEELEKIADIARKNDLLVISDEIYEKFDYDNNFFSIGSIYKKTVTLNGFSKSHSITGWRVGYAHGPKEIIEAMNKLQQYTFVCSPSFAQFALAEELSPEIGEIENYKKKRDFVYENLRDKYELNIPEGAFYAFVKIPESQKDFVNKCIKNKLLVVPGNVFSDRNDYFRISFAADDEMLKKGIEILKSLA